MNAVSFPSRFYSFPLFYAHSFQSHAHTTHKSLDTRILPAAPRPRMEPGKKNAHTHKQEIARKPKVNTMKRKEKKSYKAKPPTNPTTQYPLNQPLPCCYSFAVPARSLPHPPSPLLPLPPSVPSTSHRSPTQPTLSPCRGHATFYYYFFLLSSEYFFLVRRPTISLLLLLCSPPSGFPSFTALLSGLLTLDSAATSKRGTKA